MSNSSTKFRLLCSTYIPTYRRTIKPTQFQPLATIKYTKFSAIKYSNWTANFTTVPATNLYSQQPTNISTICTTQWTTI